MQGQRVALEENNLLRSVSRMLFIILVEQLIQLLARFKRYSRRQTVLGNDLDQLQSLLFNLFKKFAFCHNNLSFQVGLLHRMILRCIDIIEMQEHIKIIISPYGN